MQFITMNVDGLHQAAGSRNVIEVHGSVRRFRCSKCQEPCTPSLPLSPRKQPSCQVPGCGGRVRPDVTLFTEGLPQDQWRKATAAISALSPGDVLLVVGTSSGAQFTCFTSTEVQAQYKYLHNWSISRVPSRQFARKSGRTRSDCDRVQPGFAHAAE